MSSRRGAHLEAGVARVRAGSGYTDAAPRGRRRLRNGLLGLIAILFVFSVPWYRSTGDDVDVVLGLPDWVVVALGCYLAVAFCNALAWLLADVPEDPPSPAPPQRRAGGEGTS